MRPDLLRELLAATPFVPFRVYVTDGGCYDVAHPEAARVVGGTLQTTVRPTGFAGPRGERTAYVSFIHITRVEVYHPGAAPAP
jgi:hypothetical protein